VSWHNWIVRLRAQGSAVGFVQATVTRDTADVAWLIGVPWQRQRIAVEAASAVCDWLSTQGVRRLTAHIHPDHVASAKVARRLGMVATGDLDTGRRADLDRPALTAEDAKVETPPALATRPVVRVRTSARRTAVVEGRSKLLE
jgi:RimJ/RimL family protein N-acetyltransferase